MVSTHSAIESLKKQLQQLDKALSASFSNLRSDIESQASSIESLRAKVIQHERAISHLKIEAEPRDQQESHSSAKSQVSGKHSAAYLSHGNLTPLHLDILKRLMILQMESGKRTISMRELAAELYPQKPYSSIKSTLSRYINDLNRNRLVEKVRTYRLYLSYTERALQYADNERLSRMKELISQPTR